MQASLTGPDGQRTDLTSNVLTIGRAPDNQLVLEDQQASSHHAEIRPDSQGYLLVDVNSRNGTFVNEQRLMPQTPRLLFSGDVIRIGETRLSYATGSDDEATVRANAGEYGNPGYSPTVAVPPPQQPDYMNYQQPAPAAPSYSPQPQQPTPPAYSNYQQPTPSAPNYPQADQPGYNQAPQAYPTPPYSQYPQQAPWAAAPGQFGAPAAPAVERPRKRRTGLIIGLIVLLLLVVGGAIGGFVYANRSTPQKTLQDYCTALQNGDAQGAYNLLSTNARSKTSVADITKAIQIIKSPLVGGIKSCTFTNVQENGSNATADVTVAVGNPAVPTKPSKAFLINENGSWKIDTSPQSTP